MGEYEYRVTHVVVDHTDSFLTLGVLFSSLWDLCSYFSLPSRQPRLVYLDLFCIEFNHTHQRSAPGRLYLADVRVQ